jgi:predicted transposase YbfD/YdcC
MAEDGERLQLLVILLLNNEAPRRSVMTADRELTLAHHFADLTDPRIDRSRLHELLDIVAIAICAVVAGADSWDDIEDFGNAKIDWLKTFLALPNGIPSHDTFRRLFERLDPDQFQKGFLRWIEALHEATERQVVAIDGKTLRRSFDRAKGKSALHLVHAWATANHLLLGQVAVDQKSNEITAIPVLLKMLGISGAIVTIDAMGCQKEIARTIRGRKADYILALKANHERLYEQVVAFWDGACARLMKGPDIRYHREWSEGHGRDEFRRCWATSDLDWLEGREEWEGLRSVVMVEAERFIGDRLSVETRYYLSSLENAAELLNGAVRSHWGVENSLHWVLDVTFNEDRSRIKKENAPENFGLLRRLALCLLKKETTSKRSIKGKRLQAGWDDGYLQRILTGNAGN